MDEIKELAEKLCEAVDVLNSMSGDDSQLCLLCHSKSYNAKGIIHKAECPLENLRNSLAGYRKPVPSEKLIETIAETLYKFDRPAEWHNWSESWIKEKYMERARSLASLLPEMKLKDK